MPAWVIDLVIVLLILGVTYALVSESLWGAALMFFNVLFSVLIALNFYEPLAGLLASNVSALRVWADFLCLSGLFLVSLIVLKLLTENMAPMMVRFPMPVLQLGRLVFGLGGGVLTVGFLLLVLHTAPVHQKIFGKIGYDSKPPFGLALDRRLLGYFQYVTGSIFPTYVSAEEGSDRDYGNVKLFDPEGRWLLDHQNARPFPSPDGRVPPPEAATEPAGTE